MLSFLRGVLGLGSAHPEMDRGKYQPVPTEVRKRKVYPILADRTPLRECRYPDYEVDGRLAEAFRRYGFQAEHPIYLNHDEAHVRTIKPYSNTRKYRNVHDFTVPGDEKLARTLRLLITSKEQIGSRERLGQLENPGLRVVQLMLASEHHFSPTRGTNDDFRAPWRDYFGEICEHDGRSSICYTGRPKNLEDAQEIVRQIFLREMLKFERKTGEIFGEANPIEGDAYPKGIRTVDGEPGVFELTFVVQSLLSMYPAPERQMVADVFNSLSNLQEDIIVRIGEKEYTVRAKPIFLSRQVNICSLMEKAFSPTLSGKAASDFYTDQGLRQIDALITQRLKELEAIREQAQGLHRHPIEDSLEALKELLRERGNDLQPEEQIAVEYLLSKYLNIPIVLHCKDSIDRTGVGAAIMKSLHQWEKILGQSDPRVFPVLLDGEPAEDAKTLWDKMQEIFQNPDFKELFLVNLYEAVETSMRLRGRPGISMGHKEIGGRLLELTIQPHIRRLLPERCFKECSIFRKALVGFLIFLFIVPLAACYLLAQLFGSIRTELLRKKASDPSACPMKALKDFGKILFSLVFIYGFVILGFKLFKLLTPKKVNRDDPDLQNLMYFKKKLANVRDVVEEEEETDLGDVELVSPYW